jgi:D-lactate dehydrogenase (cytochrome)
VIIKKEQSEIENFLVDAANYKGYCDAVYYPETETEVIEIIKKANIRKTKITVAGNGTGLTGARVPEGGIVISTNKLNKIIEINKKEKFAVVQPGVILVEFQERISENNLFYPPDPTEQNCFIGATVATNSSGAKTFKYGATRNYVLELRIVLPTGEILNLKRGEVFANNNSFILVTETGKEIKVQIPEYKIPETKNTAGYYIKKKMDAIDLFIGSEGTLGVITQIKLKLLPKEDNLISGILFFYNEADALDFVDDARLQSRKHNKIKDESNINARGIEFFDYYSLQFLKEDYPQINDQHNAAVWFEQETTENTEEVLFEKWMNLMEKYSADIENSWFAIDKSELDKFKTFRHAISSKVSEIITKRGLRKVGTDTAVPVEQFHKYYEEMKQAVNTENIDYICYGHIGDCHLHLNMLPKNETEFVKAKTLYQLFCKRAAELGGTVSAEHGIGKMKRDYLLEMYGKENIIQMAKIKRTFDPNLILGIGNIFDEHFLKTTYDT